MSFSGLNQNKDYSSNNPLDYNNNNMSNNKISSVSQFEPNNQMVINSKNKLTFNNNENKNINDNISHDPNQPGSYNNTNSMILNAMVNNKKVNVTNNQGMNMGLGGSGGIGMNPVMLQQQMMFSNCKIFKFFYLNLNFI